MQTAVNFQEARTRIYGFDSQEGLAWARFVMPASGSAAWARWVERLAARIHLSTAGWEGGRMVVKILCCRDSDALAGLPAEDVRCPVSLLRFQGPHFGDRHGIARAALGDLARAGIAPLALVGVGHSLSLVLPPDSLDRAREALRGSFEVPAGILRPVLEPV